MKNDPEPFPIHWGARDRHVRIGTASCLLVERAVDELLTLRLDLAKVEGVGDRVKLIDVLESHYDGYRFTEDAPDRVFNSNLVVYFLRELSVRARYPRPMLDPNGRTDYQKLHSLWAAAGPAAEERREALEQILSEGNVWSDLVEQFGTRRTSTKSEFISLMYYTGMLTLSTEPPDLRTKRKLTKSSNKRKLSFAITFPMRIWSRC